MPPCCNKVSCDPFEPVGFIFDEYGQKVLPLEVIMRGMAKGTVMYKVKGPKRWYRRRYKVDIQNRKLHYSPTHKIFCQEQDVDLYEIEEVRKGWTSDVFNRLEDAFKRSTVMSTMHPSLIAALKKDNCFTVVFRKDRKVVDLIAPNSYTRDAWVRGLLHLLAMCKDTRQKEEYNRWLRSQVVKADVNNNGSLSFNECLLLLHQLNISMDKDDVKKLFDSANFRKNLIDGEDALDNTEFVHFFHSLTQRPELEEIMKSHSVNHTTLWSAEELQAFLNKRQKIDITVEESRNLIEKYENELSRVDDILQIRVNGYMTLSGFQTMLLSEDHGISNKEHKVIYQDMTQPLNHYFIATSHNTYLMSGQLIGNSSVEGYIDALKRGCRCLELDTWDGSDGEPIVFHGYTLTSRIYFRDILEAIKLYAFKSSTFPIILSIENHCSLLYQRKMVKYLESILGEYLYKDPVNPNEKEFPSPESLKKKILIKAKKAEIGESEAVLLEEEMEQERVMAGVSKAKPGEEVELAEEAPRRRAAVAKELSDLVNYCTAVRFSSFEDCKGWNFYYMASFQEINGLKFAQEQGEEFVEYNKRHLSRVYPKGTRTDSSNYDPNPYWSVGCQMVALNYQTGDKFMRLHDTKFLDNGNCGYLLKPKFLRDPNVSNYSDGEIDIKMKTQVVIKVLTGQQIPKPNRAQEGEVVDPYVVIKVAGHPLDVQKKKTSYIPNNGFNPNWNETFCMDLKFPELVIFTFLVKDQNIAGKNEILGQFSLPFTSMTEGYRQIHLEDVQGRRLVPATLFVHISIETVEPEARPEP